MILAGALVVSALVWGAFFRSARVTNNTLSVTGSAKQTVTSDLAKVTIAVEKTVPQSQLGIGYSQMARDINAVKAHLTTQGADASKIVVTAVMTNREWDNNNQFSNDPRYSLRQTVEYQSSNVEQVTKLSQSVTALSNQGIVVSIESVQYFYSKLADVRVELLGDAVADATARARRIAESAGRHIGPIQSASSGVVQVLPVNSVEISDYGAYDTSHIEKEITVTVKAAFGVN
jgi:hypothetical protein